ncbi:DUF5615 family PIN-like protein [Halococcus sp. AFM35]|uniref:DUF5615 family PIN-like protein n=1 Tax=Halococcus sp. AFM35 TaxID=3421653 RepID=UPI003EBF531E
MKILCDQHVDEKYVTAFDRADWATVARIRDLLSPSTVDESISEYAARNGWVVFTADNDFFDFDHNRGLLLYVERRNPSPGAVVNAVRVIADAYDDHRHIEEYVPGEWV